jgi:hypothetical protein
MRAQPRRHWRARAMRVGLSVRPNAFGNALGESLGKLIADARIPLPEAVARAAQTNPAAAAMYREHVRSLEAAGMRSTDAQAHAGEGFDMFSQGYTANEWRDYQLRGLTKLGMEAGQAGQMLSAMGMRQAGTREEVTAGELKILAVGDHAAQDLARDERQAELGAPTSLVGQVLNDNQFRLSKVGNAVITAGQWVGDHPWAQYAMTGVQIAAGPLMYATGQVIEHSPIGDAVNRLSEAAVQGATQWVDNEARIGDERMSGEMVAGGMVVGGLLLGGVSRFTGISRIAGEYLGKLKQNITNRIDSAGSRAMDVVRQRVQGPVDRASSQKPEWLRRLDAGNAFNKERAGIYEFDELYVNKPSGKGYFRVDSYNPRSGEIISRKFTQFSEITERTGIEYVKEMATKYPDGAKIANVPTNIENGLAGVVLAGDHVLEIPVQIKPIPQAVLDAANRASVLIRDIKGKTY